MGGMYDTIWNYKGTKNWGATYTHGAYYYAFSPKMTLNNSTTAVTNYVTTEIVLPTSLEIGKGHLRNAYIALGLGGDLARNKDLMGFVDLGICSEDGLTWHPAYMDANDTENNDQLREYSSGIGATRATIKAWAINANRVCFEVQFYQGNTAVLKVPCKQEVNIKDTLGAWNRAYRFMSLVPYPSGSTDNRTDGTKMMGAQFTKLNIRSNGSDHGWGIETNYVEHCYIMYYPKCAVVNMKPNSETGNILHQ